MRLTFGAVALALVLAACSGSPAAPSLPAAEVPPASDEPVPPPSQPAVQATDAERAILDGIRTDLQSSCEPLRIGLPQAAVAAVECAPASDTVDIVTVFAFDKQKAMLKAYRALVGTKARKHPHQGRCLPNKASEGPYVPSGEAFDTVPERAGCSIDVDGHARYVATLPPTVLVMINGKVDDVSAVEAFAWIGNQDQPGSPTIWRDGAPVDPGS
jgi:hypothetical protein